MVTHRVGFNSPVDEIQKPSDGKPQPISILGKELARSPRFLK